MRWQERDKVLHVWSAESLGCPQHCTGRPAVSQGHHHSTSGMKEQWMESCRKMQWDIYALVGLYPPVDHCSRVYREARQTAVNTKSVRELDHQRTVSTPELRNVKISDKHTIELLSYYLFYSGDTLRCYTCKMPFSDPSGGVINSKICYLGTDAAPTWREKKSNRGWGHVRAGQREYLEPWGNEGVESALLVMELFLLVRHTHTPPS